MHRDFLLEILEKNNDDECTLILVFFWKKTALLHAKIVTYQNCYIPKLLHTKISNHNIIKNHRKPENRPHCH